MWFMRILAAAYPVWETLGWVVVAEHGIPSGLDVMLVEWRGVGEPRVPGRAI